jgi:Carbohydrate esterase, sialic acid-specific acetylesterase
VRFIALSFILGLLAQPCSAQSNLYLIALLGQSNMKGGGDLSELPAGFPVNSSNLWSFSNSYEWKHAKEPIDSPQGQVDLVSLDKRAGVGPSLALADAFVTAHPNTSVGLIPCAKGGSSISSWQKTQTTQPRATLFGSCINRIKTVSPANGTLRAVIFWQGGEDAKSQVDALKWKEHFTAFVSDLRTDLGIPNLPIILVILGSPEKKALKRYPYWQVVRE